MRSDRSSDWFIQARSTRFERLEAYFSGHAYDPHRHDTYAIGITLSGIQSFRYRGVHTHSTPGHVIVIHPDEIHDGHAGNDGGFRYRMLYVAPAAIQHVLGERPLPFVAGGLTQDQPLARATAYLLSHIESPQDTFEEDDALFDLCQALERYVPAPPGQTCVDAQAARRAREYLDTRAGQATNLADLETVSGQSRWQLSRDFRVIYGTSPYRYLTLRRLDRAKSLMSRGLSMTDTAALAGFADQSHFTRQFTRAFGMSPGRWVGLQQPSYRHD